MSGLLSIAYNVIKHISVAYVYVVYVPIKSKSDAHGLVYGKAIIIQN
jgi:hypothetical protein